MATPQDEWRLRISELVRDYLAEKRISQAKAERLVGWSDKYLYKLLSGRVDMKIDHVLALLEAIDIEPDRFFGELAKGGGYYVNETSVPYDEEIYLQRRSQFPNAPDDLIKRLTKAEQDLDEASLRVSRAMRQLKLFDQ